MKILLLGLDSDILNEGSALAERFKQYGKLVQRLDLVVPAKQVQKKVLSDSVTIYAIQASNKILQMKAMSKQARSLIQNQDYDLITTRDPYYLGLLCSKLAKKYDLALEIQIHGFEKFNFLRRKIAKAVLRRADGIRAVSQRLKQRLIKEFSLPEEKISVNPIFVDCKKFQQEGILKESRPDDFTFLTIGRLVPIKNISLQLRALAQLKKKRKEKIKLIILGSGPLRQKLEREGKALGLENNLLFPGVVKNVTEYFAQADCFILSSKDEGYGIAPIEAACYGLPVIMTDVGCAGEIIKEENALIIPLNDLQALFTAMEKIMDDHEGRERMTSANRRLEKRLPSLEESLQQHLASWEKTLRQKKLQQT